MDIARIKAAFADGGGALTTDRNGVRRVVTCAEDLPDSVRERVMSAPRAESAEELSAQIEALKARLAALTGGEAPAEAVADTAAVDTRGRGKGVRVKKTAAASSESAAGDSEE